jgi:DNA-directed RNA polymerase specialized sigma24 family protein
MNRGVRGEIPAAACSAAAELYRRHHRNLQGAVCRAVDAPHELIEDACQNAWTMLLLADPNRGSIFGWLYLVATREAHRLREAERLHTHLEAVSSFRSCEAAIVGAFCIDDILEAREALDILASLPDRPREDLTLVVAGFSYDEIGEMTGGRTFSTVRKSVNRARAGVRRNHLQGTMCTHEGRATDSGERDTAPTAASSALQA